MVEFICVFCLDAVNDIVCYNCNEYKGVMPMKEAKVYLGKDFPEEFEDYV